MFRAVAPLGPLRDEFEEVHVHHRVLTGMAAVALGLLALAVPAAATDTPGTSAGTVVVAATPSASPTPLPRPARPFAYNITATSATLTWATDGSPVFRYMVYRLVDGAWREYGLWPVPPLQLTDLTPNTTYTFAVLGYPLYNSGYTTSPLSPPGTFTTLPEGGRPPSDGLTCQVTFSRYPGGFNASTTLRDGGAPAVTGWTLTFTLPANMQLASSWSAMMSIAGRRVSMRDSGWNATIAPGGTVTFGFAGSYTGTFLPPDDMTANGVPCAVQA